MKDLTLSAPTRIFLSCCAIALMILIVCAAAGTIHPKTVSEAFATEAQEIPAVLEDAEIPISGIAL